MSGSPTGLGVRHALECKAWWADKLLRGEKTVEVRQWALFDHILGGQGLAAARLWLLSPDYKLLQLCPAGTPVWLAATTGAEGQACLGDCVAAGQPEGELVGWGFMPNFLVSG